MRRTSTHSRPHLLILRRPDLEPRVAERPVRVHERVAVACTLAAFAYEDGMCLGKVAATAAHYLGTHTITPKPARRHTFGRIKRDLLRAIAAGRSGDAVNHLALGWGKGARVCWEGLGGL